MATGICMPRVCDTRMLAGCVANVPADQSKNYKSRQVPVFSSLVRIHSTIACSHHQILFSNTWFSRRLLKFKIASSATSGAMQRIALQTCWPSRAEDSRPKESCAEGVSLLICKQSQAL
jgi:hypothetical protein